MDFAKALELDDYVIDFEITPNRPDCLSMVGMAREAAATFNEKVRPGNKVQERNRQRRGLCERRDQI